MQPSLFSGTPVERLSAIVATGLGSGLSPKAPGTVGSALFVVLWWLLALIAGTPSVTTGLLGTLALTAIGVLATQSVLNSNRSKLTKKPDDPGFVVIDEWAGMSAALIGVSPSEPILIALSFGLFRLLDITKPGPIRWAERFPGAWGVILDDLIAGAISCMLLHGVTVVMIP